VLTGDLAKTDGLETVARNAHALVIEATYLDEDSDLADQFGHMTAGRVARFAAEMNVGTLLLTHLSRRYRERDVIAEAERFFPNAVVVRDFDRFSVMKDRCAKSRRGRRSIITTEDNEISHPRSFPLQRGRGVHARLPDFRVHYGSLFLSTDAFSLKLHRRSHSTM
jgi:hypothetical protein